MAQADVGPKLHALPDEPFNVPRDRVGRQPIVWDASRKESSHAGLGIKHHRLISASQKFLGGRESRRPRTDDGNLLHPRGFTGDGKGLVGFVFRPIDDKAFEVVDSDGFVDVCSHAARLARSIADATICARASLYSPTAMCPAYP